MLIDAKSQRTISSIVGLSIMLCASLATPALGSGDDREPEFRGYCPASFLLHGEARKGDPAFRSEHLGLLYFLSSEEAKKKFDADPAKYLPQYGGLCTVALGGSYGGRYPGDPEVFEIKYGKVFLLSMERARMSYHTKPDHYIETAAMRFNEPRFSGNCPVSYQSSGGVVKGSKEFRCVIGTGVYFTSSKEARDALQKEPLRFLPQFDGFCANGVAMGKRYPGDVTVFSVVDGKTYLLFDKKEKKAFDADPAPVILKANQAWKTIKIPSLKPARGN